MPAPKNLIHETSTTTGTGNFTLAAVNGKVRFSDATYGFSTGGANVFDYFIANRDAAEWERGTGSMSAASTLVRDTVIQSSNADAAVNFSAGTKDVTNDVPAASQYYVGGTDVAVADGGTGASTAAGALTNLGASPGWTLLTEQATTSGTAFDFTVPGTAKQIVVTLQGVSLSGADDILVQLGDAGGIEATGYLSTSALLETAPAITLISSTAGFIIKNDDAASVFSGTMKLVLSDATNNTWISSSVCKNATNAITLGAGDKSLSAAITTVRLTRVATSTFDAGAVNVQYS